MDVYFVLISKHSTQPARLVINTFNSLMGPADLTPATLREGRSQTEGGREGGGGRLRD